MPLAVGTKLGPYEVTAPLGAGGMGEVYRARDPRLGRDVAIKLLPDAFATDPDRLARFEREAKLLASLQHANIAVLHGLEEANGRRFLVMECVEGESLAQRLKRGALPVGETLDVARAIAAALEAAHEGGIVHRDLKPGNVMVTPAGDVKVLDFGLAKGGASSGSSDPNMSASPTMTYAGTQAGVILGTAAYMSPEQARGKSVDRRTDIWSFGCLVFECLTGRQVFAGETVSDIVARILQTEPDWATLPAGVPEGLRALLHRCLEKDAKRRLRDIGEARIEIEDLLAARSAASASAGTPRATPATPASRWLAFAVTAVAAAAASFFGAQRLMTPPAPAAARFEVLAPKGRAFWDGSAAFISPDGRTLAMVSSDSSGVSSIWVRRLDSLVPRQLPGTEGVTLLFWSPDGHSLAFFANDQTLSKIAIDGGTPERICETKSGRGGTWNPDGVILLAPYSNGGIYRVSAHGGPLVQITHPDSAHGVTGHRFPVFLPDGKHFLFTTVPAGADGKGGLCVGSIDGGATRELERGETGAVYAPPGWLLTTRAGALVAYPFDVKALRARGEPVVIGDALTGTQFSGGPVLSASSTGALAFLSRVDVPSRLVWTDLDGRVTSVPPVAPGLYNLVRLAPDDHRALFAVQAEPTRGDLVVADLERGVLTRVTQAPENVTAGVWSPDGTRIAYIDETTETLCTRSLVDGTRRTYLPSDHAYKQISQWTRDGRGLVYERLDPATKWDVWLLSTEGDSLPRPCVRTPANERFASLSPDGRWVAFQSDESGTPEFCVLPFLAPGLKYQVTIGGTGGGGWAHTGARLFFGSAREPGVVHAADVLQGRDFALGPVRVVGHVPTDFTNFDLSHDDRRILGLRPAEKSPPQTATILQNWTAAIRKP
jgi:Tol biopolymer transport system component